MNNLEFIKELKELFPYCWTCGSKRKIGQHHLQPMRVRGKGDSGKEIPLCRDCHDAIEIVKHAIDVHNKEVEKGHGLSISRFKKILEHLSINKN